MSGWFPYKKNICFESSIPGAKGPELLDPWMDGMDLRDPVSVYSGWILGWNGSKGPESLHGGWI